MAEPEYEPAVAPDHWRSTGERIEALLDASSSGGAVARERAEQLVREVVELYGAGLERILEVLGNAGAASLIDRLAADDLVASLLLVHDLHPHGVEQRVRTALDSVRPYLGSHGGDVELLGVHDGVVRLRLLGSCKSCPSSSVTLELAVQTAVQAAAPETTAIEVETGAPVAGGSLISADSLMSRVHHTPEREAAPAGAWEPVPEMADLTPGQVGGFAIDDLVVLVCRVGDAFFAFRDRCPRCTTSMAGATLERRMGHAAGTAVLRCPTCRSHYDVRKAGAGLDTEGDHLDPLPVLVRDGVLSIAVPTGMAG